jgi:hypothetical protein
MTKTHGKILVKIIVSSLKKSRRAHLLATDRKMAAGKKAKVTVRRSQFRFLARGEDVMLSAVPDLSGIS